MLSMQKKTCADAILADVVPPEHHGIRAGAGSGKEMDRDNMLFGAKSSHGSQGKK